MVKIVSLENAPKSLQEHFFDKTNLSDRERYQPKLDEKTLKLLSKNFFYYMDFFGIQKKDQSVWLGFSKPNYSTLRSYRERQTIRDDWDSYTRVADLFGIVKSLKVLYPRNEELVKNWMNVPRDIFKGKTAKDFIVEKPHESLMRIKAVRRILDLYRNGSINDLT